MQQFLVVALCFVALFAVLMNLPDYPQASAPIVPGPAYNATPKRSAAIVKAKTPDPFDMGAFDPNIVIPEPGMSKPETPHTVNDLYSGYSQGQRLLVRARLIASGWQGNVPQVAFGDKGGYISCLVSPSEFYAVTEYYVMGDVVTFHGIFEGAERRNGQVVMRHCQLSER